MKYLYELEEYMNKPLGIHTIFARNKTTFIKYSNNKIVNFFLSKDTTRQHVLVDFQDSSSYIMKIKVTIIHIIIIKLIFYIKNCKKNKK